MSRLSDALARARAEGRAALVIYLTAGDPSLEATAQLVRAAADAGADIIELGVPFSDPTADGPTIQRASERALRDGATLPGVLDAVRAIRREREVPLLLFGYYNPILAYGEAALARDAADAGVDGLLVVDLPPEEADALREATRKHGLDMVPLVAPTSPPERIARAAAMADAFVYYVSVTGVTGGEGIDFESVRVDAARVRSAAGKPVAVGFGVRSGSDASTLASDVDAVVVGSAVVRRIEEARDVDGAIREVDAFVRELATGCRPAP